MCCIQMCVSDVSYIDCDCSCLFFFFKQKTAYEMRISDWSSDVCSSDLFERKVMSSDYKIISSDSHAIEPWFMWRDRLPKEYRDRAPRLIHGEDGDKQIGRASCRERVGQYV